MSELLVFSCNADPLLIASAKHFGVSLKPYNVAWKGHVESKLREGVKFLQSQSEPIAMFLDGFDTLILKPEDEILARWNALGAPLLIAAESQCWPDAEMAEKYPAHPHPPFLNAGGFIGLRSDVLTAMHTALQWATTDDDQRAWTAAYLGGAVKLQIDHGRRIFCSQGDGETESADPCTRHWNGRTPGREDFWDGIK